MRSALWFISILATLFLYTVFKAAQLWPAHRFLAAAISVPIFAIIVGWQFLYRSQPELVDAAWFEAFSWVGSVTMGIWATFIIISIPLDLIHLLVTGFQKVTQAAEHEPQKRAFLGEGFRLGVLGMSGVFASIGLVQVLRGPKLKEVTVPIANLPESLVGLKIAQISDLHVGSTIRKSYVEEMVRRVNATQPDLIVVTGDLADGKVASIAKHMQPLADFKSPNGVFYVTGNHEYYWGAEALLSQTKTLGFQALLNENKILKIKGGKVLVAGVTDPAGGSFIRSHEPDAARAALSSEEVDFRLLLAHRPDACVEAESLGFDLQLSGHTHAGQFFPFNVFMPLAHKYYRGLNQHGKLWVYVNSGTGYWGPANRFAIGSEITLIQLARA